MIAPEKARYYLEHLGLEQAAAALDTEAAKQAVCQFPCGHPGSGDGSEERALSQAAHQACPFPIPTHARRVRL